MNPTLAQLEAAAKSSLPPRALHVEPPIPMRTADEAGHTRKESQATQLVALASQRGMFFHSSDQEPFAEIQCGDHREVWPIKSKTFRHWLAGVFYQAKNSAVGGQGMQDALAVMSSMALFDGPEKEVSLRVAGSNEGIYYDIGNADWQAVHVTACGWEIINVVPVAFRRSKGMTALPTPTRGGSVELLRDVLNVADDTQWTLLVGFVLASLRPSGPYPVLVLDGEQGTGKTFRCFYG